MDIALQKINPVDGVDKCFEAFATLPGRRHPLKLLVFDTGDGLLAISAYCPHQGYDLTGQKLNARGNLVCPHHDLEIYIKPGETGIYEVAQNGDSYSLRISKR